MRASLQLRLFAVAALTLVSALVVVSLLGRQAARTEFRRFTVSELSARGGGDEALAERVGREPDPARLDTVLAELGRLAQRELLLMSPEGRRIAASSPELREARITVGREGEIAIDRQTRRGSMSQRTRGLIHGGPRPEVRRPDGRLLGTLVVLPLSDDPAEARPAAFGSAFDMRLLWAAVVAGLVALALTWLMSRRVLEPVAELTRAAGRLGRGDLTQRVVVRTGDELGELSRTFNAMAESLARQESLRRTLVTDVAHELRTPLTNLRCQIEAIEDGLLAPSAETVRSLREDVLLLARLVEDLQTLSVAEAGKLALDRSAVGVRELVDGALDSFARQAAEHQVELKSDVPELPAVNVDPTRIGQVLRNLLTNAITHTPGPGTIVVTAGRHAEQGLVTLAVRDSGDGIAPEHLPHVFERFYRADPSRARATGGAGLGLAIVKGIVEAHGGTVTAESSEGRGTTIRFTLPVA